MTILIIAEHDHKNLKPATLCTVTAARELKQAIHIVVIGNAIDAVVAEAAKVADVEKIIAISHAGFEKTLAETYADAVLKIAGDYAFILAPATTFGKNILPRVAAKLDVQQVSDVIAIESPTRFIHPIYAGNARETVETTQNVNVMTVRPTAFAAAKIGDGAASVAKVDVTPANGRSQFVSIEESKGDRPELTAARIVVSGGRGVGSKENFKVIEGLADDLKAAVGASRAAVDAGFVPNDYQVGQTGKIVAPDLYVACGISGAIQHLAGMSGAKIVVAINKDPDAPIFQVADYGLVADLFTAIPEIQAALKS